MNRLVIPALSVCLLVTAGPAQARQKKKDAPPQTPSLLAIVPNSATRGDTFTARVTGKFLGKIDRWTVEDEGVSVVASETAADGASATLSIRIDPTAKPIVTHLRGAGLAGPTNPVRLGIDTLPTDPEIEPNDRPDQAQNVAIGRAVAAVLKPTDRDVYAVEAAAGSVLSISCQARRLGVPIQPQIAVTRDDGRFVARFLGSPGADGDLMFALPIAESGRYLLEFRDTVYHGHDQAGYRLRIEGPDRFATGLSPLAVAAGVTTRFELSGGSLTRPLTVERAIPGDGDGPLTLEPFDGPAGPIPAPQSVLRVRPGSLKTEPLKDGATLDPTALVSIAGRLNHADEVDRYPIALTKGHPITIRVRAAEPGSWIDSVLAVTDPSDPTRVLAENDDRPRPGGRPQGGAPVPRYVDFPADSVLYFDPPHDATFAIEVADRFGRGGPEFGYVLEVGPPAPRLDATVLLAPSPDPSLTIRPGQTIKLDLQVAATGDLGVVRLRAVDLPQGLAATTAEIKPAAAPKTGPNAGGPSITPASLTITADDDAVPTSGPIRVVAEASPPGGQPLTVEASWLVTIATLPAHPSDTPIVSARSLLPVMVAPPFEPVP